MPPKGLFLWFGALLILSILSRMHVQGERPERCSLDGAAIDRVHRVDRMLDGVVCASFCSIACALAWPEAKVAGYWQVYDEIRGKPIDASRACFVLSRVVTVAARGERIHAFKDWIDAKSHCEHFGGARIPNPFATHAAARSDEKTSEHE